jgi:hypothetical protein
MSKEKSKAQTAITTTKTEISPAVLKQQSKAARKAAKQAKSQQIKGELKVPRGTERARRRAGLVKNWRNIKGAKQMLPVKGAEFQEGLI